MYIHQSHSYILYITKHFGICPFEFVKFMRPEKDALSSRAPHLVYLAGPTNSHLFGGNTPFLVISHWYPIDSCMISKVDQNHSIAQKSQRMTEILPGSCWNAACRHFPVASARRQVATGTKLGDGEQTSHTCGDFGDGLWYWGLPHQWIIYHILVGEFHIWPWNPYFCLVTLFFLLRVRRGSTIEFGSIVFQRGKPPGFPKFH